MKHPAAESSTPDGRDPASAPPDADPLVRRLPFTLIVLASWACLVLGGLLGWTPQHSPLGPVWQVLIMPFQATATLVSGVVDLRGPWISLPFVALVALAVDGGFGLARKVFARTTGPGAASS